MKPLFEITDWHMLGVLFTKSIDQAKKKYSQFNNIKVQLQGGETEKKIRKAVDNAGGTGSDKNFKSGLKFQKAGMGPHLDFYFDSSSLNDRSDIYRAAIEIFSALGIEKLDDATIEENLYTPKDGLVCVNFKIV